LPSLARTDTTGRLRNQTVTLTVACWAPGELLPKMIGNIG
jgi:hypothetical protein